MELVSIVTTTFNRVAYLKEAIQSALSQSFTEFELLVCDDGAQEETKLLCQSFGDPRIRHIVNDSSLGIAMNTYSGIMHAKGSLIAILNDDDRWTPDFLARCTRPFFDDPEVVLTFSDHWLIDSSGVRLTRRTEDNTLAYGRHSLPEGCVDDRLKLLAENSIPLAMGAVFRKSAVDWSMYSREVEGSYDYFLTYCLVRSGGKIFHVPERLTEYRLHQGSASAKFNLTNSKGASYIYRLILGDPRFSSVAEAIRRRCAALELHIARVYFQRREVMSALSHSVKSVQIRFGWMPHERQKAASGSAS